MAVELAPGGVNDASCARNLVAAVLDKSINVIVFHHVAEVVFLAPATEHAPGDGGAGEGAGGGDDGSLVAAVGQAEGSGGALVGAGAGGADGGGGLGIGATALGFGGRVVGGGRRDGLVGGGGFGDSSSGDGLVAQGAVFDAGEPGVRGDGVALVEQGLGLRGCFDVDYD